MTLTNMAFTRALRFVFNSSVTTALMCGVAVAEGTHSGESVGTQHETHSLHTFELGFGATITDHDEAFTIVASYGYHFAKHTSIGALAEYSFDPLDAWIVGIPLKYHTESSWVFTAMPGVEFHESHEEAVFRVGVGYEFVFNDRPITPEISATWIDDDVDFFLGIMFGF